MPALPLLIVSFLK